MIAIRWLALQLGKPTYGQSTGWFLLIAALMQIVRPQSAPLAWIDRTFDFHGVIIIFAVYMLICAYLLILYRPVTIEAYSLLTLPIGGYGFIIMWYALAGSTTSLIPGFFIILFWLTLQVQFVQREAHETWRKYSERS